MTAQVHDATQVNRPGWLGEIDSPQASIETTNVGENLALGI
jgi:hypothetical protein